MVLERLGRSSSSLEEGGDDLDRLRLNDEVLRLWRVWSVVSSGPKREGKRKTTRTDLDIHRETRDQERDGSKSWRRSNGRGLASRGALRRSKGDTQLDSRLGGCNVGRRLKE